jgi:hypothetical protein
MKSTPEELRDARNFRLNHKAEIKIWRKQYYDNNLDRLRLRGRNNYYVQRDKARKLIGDKCIICGYSGPKLTFHEIYGKPHRDGLKYYIDNFKDFIPLCYPHHKVLHSLIKLSLTEYRLITKYLMIIGNKP